MKRLTVNIVTAFSLFLSAFIPNLYLNMKYPIFDINEDAVPDIMIYFCDSITIIVLIISFIYSVNLICLIYINKNSQKDK